MTVTAVLSVPMTDAYKAKPQAVNDGLANIANESGFVALYVGEQIERDAQGRTVLWVFFEWESAESFKSFEGSDHSLLDQIGKDLVAGPPTVHLLPFPSWKASQDKGTGAALSHPVTEVTSYKVTKAENGAKLDALLGSVGSLQPASAYATSVNDSSVKYLVLGWASLDAHNQARDDPKGKAMGEEMKALADFTVVHVQFKKF